MLFLFVISVTGFIKRGRQNNDALYNNLAFSKSTNNIKGVQMAIEIIGDIKQQSTITHHKSWKGNFTWRDMAWLLLGWIIGITWMLVWILALGVI